MKNTFLILPFLILTSCSQIRNEIEVSVINKSNFSLKNIKCYTSENKEFVFFNEILINEEKSKFLSMKGNKKDGHYIIEFSNENGDYQKHEDGYFTNGFPLGQLIEFEIQNDTVIFKYQ